MSRRDDLEFIDHVPMRVHGAGITDTYVMATRFRVVGDPAHTRHAIDGDAAEELLFAIVQAHHGLRRVAKYEWYTPLEMFVLVTQQGPELLDVVDIETWEPDTDLAVLDRAEVPGFAHEFWLDDLPISASFVEVPQAEFDQAMRPLSTA